MEVPNISEAFREQIVEAGSLIRFSIPLGSHEATVEFEVNEQCSLQASMENYLKAAQAGLVKEVPPNFWGHICRVYRQEMNSPSIAQTIVDQVFRKPSNIVVTNAANDLDMFASYLESSAGEWEHDFKYFDQLHAATDIFFMKFRGTYGCSNFLLRYRDVVQALCDAEIRHELNISPLIEETTLADVAKVCRAFVKDYELAPVAELAEV